MKEYTDIQDILERYWEGESTLEEERLLRSYFSSGKVDERWRHFAPMFQALREEKAVQLPKSANPVPMRPVMNNWNGWAMAASVALLLGVAWWSLHQDASITPMAVQNAVDLPRNNGHTQVDSPNTASPVSSIAREDHVPKIANQKKPMHRPVKTEPEIDEETAQAMAEIKAALALVSSKIGKGRSEAAKGAIHLDAMDRVIKKKEG